MTSEDEVAPFSQRAGVDVFVAGRLLGQDGLDSTLLQRPTP